MLDATQLKDGIYVAANIGVQIIMYVQIFILVKAAFFLQGIQRSSLIIKKHTKQSKTFILMKLTKNLVHIASSSWTTSKLRKIYT